MKSIGQMIMQIDGLLGTQNLSEWENEFVENIVERTNHGNRTTGLSPKQVEVVERIYRKHFA